MSFYDCWVINPEFAKGFDKEIIDIGGRPHVYVPELGILCTIADTYPSGKEALRGGDVVRELGKQEKA